LDAGAFFCTELLAAPQAASTLLAAEQDTLLLFFVVQLHVHGPLPCTVLFLPRAHSCSDGACVTPCPAALPQAAFSSTGAEGEGAGFGVACGVGGSTLAVMSLKLPEGDKVEQDDECPLISVHVHIHAPSPLTSVATPLLQRSLSGASSAASSDAGPQISDEEVTAVTGWDGAALGAGAVLLLPDAATGAEVATGAKVATDAVQLCVSPPSVPAQFHDHGPDPATRVARP
jgi:hypothetical protein